MPPTHDRSAQREPTARMSLSVAEIDALSRVVSHFSDREHDDFHAQDESDRDSHVWLDLQLLDRFLNTAELPKQRTPATLHVVELDPESGIQDDVFVLTAHGARIVVADLGGDLHVGIDLTDHPTGYVDIQLTPEQDTDRSPRTSVSARATTRPDVPGRAPAHQSTSAGEWLTTTQVGAEFGVSRAAVHGWYLADTPTPFPRPLRDPVRQEGEKHRRKRQWHRSQLQEIAHWVHRYRSRKTADVSGVDSSNDSPKPTKSPMPSLVEFLRDARSASGPGPRRGRIAHPRVRKLFG